MAKKNFSSNAERLCLQVRDMLWKEKKDVDYCIKLTMGLLVNPDISDEERKAHAIEILEGKKILKGDGENFFLEDDNNEVRSLTKLIKMKQNEINYCEMLKHMDQFPTIYVDTCTIGMSMLVIDDSGATKEEVINYRMYGSMSSSSRKFNPKGYLKNGAYLLTDTKTAFEILGGACKDRKEVLDKCTTFFNKKLLGWKKQGITYEKMNEYQREIYSRNVSAENNVDFPYADEEILRKKYIEDNVKEESKKDFSSFQTFDLLLDGIREDEKVQYIGQPDEEDNYISEHGWIDPEGKYYSTRFGGHQVKAQAIIQDNPQLDDEFSGFYKKHNHVSTDRYDLCGAFLESKGWGRFADQQNTGTSSLYIGMQYEITDQQKETCLKLKEHFNLGYNPANSYRRYPIQVRGVSINE